MGKGIERPFVADNGRQPLLLSNVPTSQKCGVQLRCSLGESFAQWNVVICHLRSPVDIDCVEESQNAIRLRRLCVLSSKGGVAIASVLAAKQANVPFFSERFRRKVQTLDITHRMKNSRKNPCLSSRFSPEGSKSVPFSVRRIRNTATEPPPPHKGPDDAGPTSHLALQNARKPSVNKALGQSPPARSFRETSLGGRGLQSLEGKILIFISMH
jgi:hypothetical protein